MPRSRGARERASTGIYRDARGYELQACVGGERKAARLPLGTSRAALQAAMEDLRSGLRAKAKKRLRRRGAQGTLRAVAPEYLAAVKGMASDKSRRRQIELWVDVLGDRKLATITHLEIAQQLQRWRAPSRAIRGTTSHRPTRSSTSSTCATRCRTCSRRSTRMPTTRSTRCNAPGRRN